MIFFFLLFFNFKKEFRIMITCCLDPPNLQSVGIHHLHTSALLPWPLQGPGDAAGGCPPGGGRITGARAVLKQCRHATEASGALLKV